MSDKNPLIARVRIPGQRFTLPSGGLFYKNGELDDSVTNGEVEVQPITMTDDLVLKNPDKLLNGDGITEVIARCVPQIKKPWDLLHKDVDFLVVALRIVSYGEHVEVSHVHDTCPVTYEKDGETLRHSRVYKANIRELMNKTKRIDPTTIDTKFKIKLDNDQEVSIKPMTFRAFVNVMNLQLENEEDFDSETLKKNILDMLLDVILTVDEISDRQMIHDWLIAAGPKIVGQLNEEIARTFSWGTDMTIQTTCVDCEEKIEVAIPIDPLSFFS